MLRSIGSDAIYKRIMVSGYDNRAELLSLAMFGNSDKSTSLCGIRTYMQMVGDDLMNLVFGDEKTHKAPNLAYVFETVFEEKTHKLEIFTVGDEIKAILLIDKNPTEVANKDRVLTKFKDIIR